MSAADLLVALYFRILRIRPDEPRWPHRDRFILSKGHAATALYAVLAQRGFFDPRLLDTYNEDGAVLSQHPSLQCVPGVEAATGSLGHGLPIDEFLLVQWVAPLASESPEFLVALMLPARPDAELSRMNGADTAAAVLVRPQRRKIRSGVRKIPPPVPVRPDSRPSSPPAPRATSLGG